MTDNTIKASPRTIRLKGVGRREERPCSTTITPGMLCRFTTADQFAVHNVAAKKCAPCFALENELFGKGIDDNYVSGDLVQTETFSGGDWALALLAAGATAIDEGDYLVSAGDGTLQKTTSEYDDAIAVAMQAVNNSGGSDLARIMVMII
jgi:hypothetical protein